MFEQHVGAYWLGHLVAGAIPPIWIDATVTKVHFQTEHLGWCTDDLLVECYAGSGRTRRLACHVRSNVRVSTSDERFKTAVEDFWSDYNSPTQFSSTDDRLVLVIQRGSANLLEHFAGLLDCARVASSHSDFRHRLEEEGFVSNTVRKYWSAVLTIIRELESDEEEDALSARVWQFLRVVHVLSLDLATSTRQCEAQLKSMLGHFAVGGSPLEVAQASWDALLRIASDSAPKAASLVRADLPVSLLNDLSTFSVKDRQLLGMLAEHSDPVLRGVRTVFGEDFHLDRGPVVQELMRQLEAFQVVLVSGPAGSGKSAIAKGAVEFLSADHFVFAFRVEEFARAHIDAVLQAAQIPSQAVSVFAMLGTQDQIVILVDATERILERSTRDAFSDLISLAADNPAIRVILTCRDYSTELVRSALLQGKPISSTVLSVPPLTDSELDEVAGTYPALTNPLSNTGLREVLRNPYFLDKALELSWSAGEAPPETEREFRDRFWRDVIRADATAPAGMPARREATFIGVAIARAQALSTFVRSAELDQEGVEALKRDSLLASPDQRPGLVSTPHDVLEDWAILRWLDARLEAAEGMLVGMASIGAHPAIRRSYRRWLEELLQRDPVAAERLFDDAFADESVSAQFRDDTITSLLGADKAPAFLESRGPHLMANNAALLKRLIHLLRVACVGTPSWSSGDAALPQVFSEPIGPSWPVVLRLFQENIEVFSPTERLSLIGLLEDATRGLSWWVPTLDGAEFVAAAAYRILSDLDDYRAKDSRRRVLKVIAKVPKADSTRFEIVLRGTVEEHGRLDAVAKDFRQMILFGMEGMHVARDLPDLLVSVAKDSLLATAQDAKPYEYWDLDMGPQFGLKSLLDDHSVQTSAIHGPWLHLLRYHPTKGLAFLRDVFNHSANTYAETRGTHALEPAEKIQLTFPDGKVKTHWGNQRLWNLYRGSSVGPYVLISMLMALERFLLDVADRRPDDLDRLLTSILMSTDSASLAAVVASAATAHPRIAGETLLALLSAPAYIKFDQGRLVAESHAIATSRMAASVLSTAESEVYGEERAKADALTHRGTHLETAILELQFGPFAPRVAAALDAYKQSLPPVSAQTESDRMWRLALHRMDLRGMKLSEPEEEVSDDDQPSENQPPAKKKRRLFFRLLPKRLDPDLAPIVEQNEIEHARVGAQLEVLMWGIRVWERDYGSHDPSCWREMLSRARTTSDFETATELGTENAPGAVAAVCIRDHWTEMSASEQSWCAERACSEVLRTADNWSSLERVQRNAMAADRHGAAAVVALVRGTRSESLTTLARQAFVSAVTHPVDEVRAYALNAIDEGFWESHPNVAMRCVHALATEAIEIREVFAALARKREQAHAVDEVAAEVANSVRSRFWETDGIRDDVLPKLHPPDRFVSKAITYTLTVLGRAPNNPHAVAAFVDACQFVVDGWDARYEDRMDYGSIETQLETLRLVEQFCMRASDEDASQVLAAMLKAVDRHPDEVYWFVQGLTQIEDVEPNTRHYWHLWQLFADQVKKAKWIGQVERTHHPARGLLAAIFLTLFWKDNVRHWRSLEGYSDRVHALFDALPFSGIVLDCYLAFLYHIGERSLPKAFVRVANWLRRGEVQLLFESAESMFLLEVLLQRHVYGRPAELKAHARKREAVLFLLDVLVEGGSSAAFRMRDDFVTPAA
ncbi:MAG: ATP-binding protein [Gammaproteobacteria bacterium]|nr:ATP-binding protein [Gammaproteobacteria bacterium]